MQYIGVIGYLYHSPLYARYILYAGKIIAYMYPYKIYIFVK